MLCFVGAGKYYLDDGVSCLRRGTFSLAKKYPKRHLRGFPLRDSPARACLCGDNLSALAQRNGEAVATLTRLCGGKFSSLPVMERAFGDSVP